MQSVAILLVSGFIASVLAANARIGPLPKCNCNGLSCECCVGFMFKQQGKSYCFKMNYDVNRLVATGELLMDGNSLISKTLGPDLIPICAPAPVPPLILCLTPRDVYFDADNVKLCLTMSVKTRRTQLYQTNLPCLVKEGGAFKISLT